jgi:hypothetical protein
MNDSILSLSHKEFLKMDRNYGKAALAASLVYVSDKQQGSAGLKRGRALPVLMTISC